MRSVLRRPEAKLDGDWRRSIAASVLEAFTDVRCKRSAVTNYTTNYTVITTTQINSASHPSRVAKSSTSFGWGKGGKVTTAGWQVTPCDPTWHVISVAAW